MPEEEVKVRVYISAAHKKPDSFCVLDAAARTSRLVPTATNTLDLSLMGRTEYSGTGE